MFCSRRNAEELIIAGKVTVNGENIKIGDKAEYSDDIKIGKVSISKEEKVYLMINKPRGYITTNSDLFDRKKVVDLIDVPQRVFPIGRLDRDANGLLLLTNDGEWANKIMHPRYGKEKEYEAEIEGVIDSKTIAEMNRGFKLKDGFITPIIRMKTKNYCSIVIHEGRNKIVKRIFNHFGYRVTNLKRIRIGPYKLKNLKPKCWVHVDPNLIKKSEIQKKPLTKKAIEDKKITTYKEISNSLLNKYDLLKKQK